MNSLLPQLQGLVRETASSPIATAKGDGSPVTELDLALSTLIEAACMTHYPGACVYSEENFSEWFFPLLAIDPLDGTKEFIAGRPEWSMSVAHLERDRLEGEGWICNPLTNEIFSSPSNEPRPAKESYVGEVSRSEWEQGLFKQHNSMTYSIRPMGSIAYKLGRLSAGHIDFVVSLAPKNIWDIAAGTILCRQAGMVFLSEGREVIEARKLYAPPLIWCPPSLASELSGLFC